MVTIRRRQKAVTHIKHVERMSNNNHICRDEPWCKHPVQAKLYYVLNEMYFYHLGILKFEIKETVVAVNQHNVHFWRSSCIFAFTSLFQFQSNNAVLAKFLLLSLRSRASALFQASARNDWNDSPARWTKILLLVLKGFLIRDMSCLDTLRNLCPPLRFWHRFAFWTKALTVRWSHLSNLEIFTVDTPSVNNLTI